MHPAIKNITVSAKYVINPQKCSKDSIASWVYKLFFPKIAIKSPFLFELNIKNLSRIFNNFIPKVRTDIIPEKRFP